MQENDRRNPGRGRVDEQNTIKPAQNPDGTRQNVIKPSVPSQQTPTDTPKKD
jgi:Flp pilus assembly CpaF family ATPase